MARKTRALTEEDARLWSLIATGVTPLAGRDPKPSANDTGPGGVRSEAHKLARKAAQKPASACDLQPITSLPPQVPASMRAGPLIKPFNVGAASAQRADSGARPRDLAEQLHQAPSRMDHHTRRRLIKGKLQPQARIDLHGMTLAVAQPALTSFIMRARASGLRLVLVITGKGRNSSDTDSLSARPGALRHQVPHWLHMGLMASAVAQVLPAHDRHGGGGAYYVWLRKPGR